VKAAREASADLRVSATTDSPRVTSSTAWSCFASAFVDRFAVGPIRPSALQSPLDIRYSEFRELVAQLEVVGFRRRHEKESATVAGENA
jgi:hypothetical protein